MLAGSTSKLAPPFVEYTTVLFAGPITAVDPGIVLNPSAAVLPPYLHTACGQNTGISIGALNEIVASAAANIAMTSIAPA
jgi:hypothetical protein